MAQKKNEEPKVKAAEDTNVTIEATNETEKEAKNVRTKSISKSKKYKLKDPSKQYSEPGFTIAGTQEKELPENPSDQLIQRIRNGFIVEA